MSDTTLNGLVEPFLILKAERMSDPYRSLEMRMACRAQSRGPYSSTLTYLSKILRSPPCLASSTFLK